MSTLKAINLQHPSGSNNNIILDTVGGCIANNNFTANGSITSTGAIVSGTTVADSTAIIRPLVSMSSQTTTSGTSFDFTGIPSWVKRITVMFQGVSLSGTDDILVQAIVAGSNVATGYSSVSSSTAGTSSSGGLTTGFNIRLNAAADALSGNLFLLNITGNSWTSNHSAYRNSTTTSQGGGSVSLAGTLTGLRILSSVNNTFDAGTINVMYE